MTKTNSIPPLSTMLATARETAVSAGTLMQEMLSQPRQLSSKGFRDIVTDADFAAQRLITDAIQARFPDHGFVTEETDKELPTDGPVIWVIDPIDGTNNYSRGVPIFCTSIAAMVPVGNQIYHPVIGAVYDPLRQELFSCAIGQGVTLNNEARQISDIDTLADSLVCLDWSTSHAARQQTQEIVTRLAPEIYTFRTFGSATLAIAWLAVGRLQAYFNFTVKLWDVAAAGLMVQETGGQLSTPQGEPFAYDRNLTAVIVSNGHIHAQLMAHILARKE